MSENRTNYLKGSTSTIEEQKALDEICTYLTSMGKYESIEEAKEDAINCVEFLRELNLYNSDPFLIDASYRKEISTRINIWAQVA